MDKVLEKRRQTEAAEKERKRKLKESQKAEDDLLEINLDEVITGRIEMKKAKKKEPKLNNFLI